MSDEQKYAVELELVTTNYNKKLQDVVNITQTQAKLIEQKSRVNFNGYFPMDSSKTFALGLQTDEIEEYQNQIKNVISDLKVGKIDTSQAKASINDLLNDIKLTNDAFASYTNTLIKINVNDSELSLLKQAGTDTKLIDDYVKVTSQDLNKSSDSANKLKDSLNDASNEAKKLSENTNNANKKTSELGQNFEKSMNKGYTSAKRLLLSMFGIQSVWSLISRASSNAMSNNDMINSKVNVLNSALGNIMLPVVQKIVGYAEYGVIFVSKVIQFFTGFNALANLTTSNLKNSVKQAKELTKTLAGFDEITNIGQSSKGSLASGIKNDLQALDDFYKKIEEVENWMKNSGIYDFLGSIKAVLTPLWNNILKPMIDYAIQHPEVFTTLFSIFLGTKLASGISNIIGSGNTGLMGLHGWLGKLAMIGVTVITIKMAYDSVKNAYEAIVDLNNAYLTLTDTSKLLIGKNDDVTNSFLEQYKSGQLTEEQIRTLTNVQLSYIGTNESTLESLINGLPWWTRFIGLTDEETRALQDGIEEQLNYIDNLWSMYTTGVLTQEQVDEFKNKLEQEIVTLENANKKLGYNSDEYKKNEEAIQKTKDKLDLLKNGNYDTSATINISAKDNTDYSNFATKVAQGIGGIFNKIGGSIKSIASGTINSVLKSIGSFDVGTNYIPNDQLAMVHKGEMIVPAKYNPATSGINGGHDEEIIGAIYELKETLENKDMNAYISEDAIGQASSNYRNRRSRQLGKDVG